MEATTLSSVDAVAETARETDRLAAGRRSRWRSIRSRLGALASPTSPALVYAGVALIVVSFAVLAYTWGHVAGTALVALQLPYIVSGGFAAIASLAIGVLLVHLGTKRREAFLRDRRLEQLAAALDALAKEPQDREDHP
jgi:Flp pilus assembly protein TadB